MAYKSIWKVFGSLVIDFGVLNTIFFWGRGQETREIKSEAEGRLNQINFFLGGVFKEYISLNIRHFLCLN